MRHQDGICAQHKTCRARSRRRSILACNGALPFCAFASHWLLSHQSRGIKKSVGDASVGHNHPCGRRGTRFTRPMGHHFPSSSLASARMGCHKSSASTGATKTLKSNRATKITIAYLLINCDHLLIDQKFRTGRKLPYSYKQLDIYSRNAGGKWHRIPVATAVLGHHGRTTSRWTSHDWGTIAPVFRCAPTLGAIYRRSLCLVIDKHPFAAR